MSFAPLKLTLARRESFTVEPELQEELNEIQEKLRAQGLYTRLRRCA